MTTTHQQWVCLTLTERDALLAEIKRLREAIQERVAAKDEYDSNPAVTSERCGKADERLREQLANLRPTGDAGCESVQPLGEQVRAADETDAAIVELLENDRIRAAANEIWSYGYGFSERRNGWSVLAISQIITRYLVSSPAEQMKAAMIEKVWEMQLAMDAGKVGSKALLADVITELQQVEVK